MAEQEEMANANGTDSTPPDQQPSNVTHSIPSDQQPKPDWDAISNLIASALINTTNSSPPEKQPKHDKMAIFNTVVSVFTLLVTLFIATYGTLWVNSQLNVQNGQIQDKLARLNADLQREANFAQLEVDCFTNCFVGFEVKNTSRSVRNKTRV